MNDEIIKKVTTYNYGCICITKEMNDYIHDNYTEINTVEEGPWYKVYREGNDAKYGHYMINPYTKKRRDSTFDEFYGGIVD